MTNTNTLWQWEQESTEISQWLWNLFQQFIVDIVNLANTILQIPLALGKEVNDWLKNISKEALKLLSLEDLEKKLKQEERYVLFLETSEDETKEQKRKDLAIEILTKELSQEDEALVRFYKEYGDIEKVSLSFIQCLRKIFQNGSLEIPWIDKKEDWARDKAIFFINMMKIIDGLKIDSTLELVLQTILENYFEKDNLDFSAMNVQSIQEIANIFSNLNRWNWEINQVLSQNNSEYIEKNLAFANDQMKQIPQKYDEYVKKVFAFVDDEMKQVLEMSEKEKIIFISKILWYPKKYSVISKGIVLLLQWKKLEDLFTGRKKEEEIDQNQSFLLSLEEEIQRIWVPITREELDAFIWKKLSYDRLDCSRCNI